MSYIITANVHTDTEANLHGDKAKVAARISSERDGTIPFNVRGHYDKQAELIKALCNSLIDAGFIAFSIGHSF